MQYTNLSKGLVDSYRWYRQQNPRDHGGHASAYPAKLSLAMARSDVAKGTKRYPHAGKPYAGQWQGLDTMPRNTDSRAYYCDTWPDGLRDRGDAHKLARIGHTGWYADSFQDSLVIGRVLQMPARNGKPVYVPGTYSTGSDGVTLYLLDHYDEESDCALAADRYAEHAAEIEREYDEAWQAGARAADHDEEAKRSRSALLAKLAAFREVRNTMREIAAEVLAEICESRGKRDKLRSDWRSSDAFNEGFGR